MRVRVRVCVLKKIDNKVVDIVIMLLEEGEGGFDFRDFRISL